MKQITLLSVAILFGVAVSAPAQISIAGRIAGHVRAAITVGASHDRQIHDDRRGSGERQSSRGEPGRRHFVEPRGRWETVSEQVLVPGYWREESVPPIYGWVLDECGHRQWGIVQDGGCRRVWVPARWETRCRRVWVGC